MKLSLTLRGEQDTAHTLQIDMTHVIALEQTDLGTRVHTTAGQSFLVWETIETIEEYQRL